MSGETLEAIGIREILAALPHRYPFLLVDRIKTVELGKRIVALKNVTINEPFFQGHFPGRPIMPGVLILEAMAQAAGMSTEAFEDFFFDVCTLDYRKLQPGMKALKGLMEQTDRVQIKGPGTDLNFSIKGIPAVICGGDRNIPDGEVFTAPVKDSVEGQLTFNAPSIYQGTAFDGILLNFKRGKIVEASSNETKKLNKILDSDTGARYIGEFSLGFNPRVFQPMRDILFDEKIAGSFHFTPGQAYEEADNGNRSQVHWDMVSIQRPDYDGGEIYFDGKLIRKNGEFLPKQLRSLNWR